MRHTKILINGLIVSSLSEVYSWCLNHCVMISLVLPYLYQLLHYWANP